MFVSMMEASMQSPNNYYKLVCIMHYLYIADHEYENQVSHVYNIIIVSRLCPLEFWREIITSQSTHAQFGRGGST